ncbi:hypothetical protein Micbo1qcDRAFT_166160, partial [Microdochium bolleyi]
MRDLGATAVTLGSSRAARTSLSASSHDEPSEPPSAMDNPPQYEEAERQFQQQQLLQQQQEEAARSSSPRGDTSASTQSFNLPGTSQGPPEQQVQLHGQMQPYQRVL